MGERVVVVTGGTRGIGFAIAREFLAAGDRVVVCGSSKEHGEHAVEMLCSEGFDHCMFKVLDVRDVDGIIEFFAAVASDVGPVDVLVNNAGVQLDQPVDAVTKDAWDRVVNTNQRGLFFCSQQAVRYMPQGGSIVNIGSVQSVYIAQNQSVYAATKAAMVQLTRCFAKEWAQKGIRVNCIAPGSIPTDINKQYYSDPANLQRTLGRIPLGRQGDPSEVAKTVRFLASDDASYITGQTIYVDGGWLLV